MKQTTKTAVKTTTKTMKADAATPRTARIATDRRTAARTSPQAASPAAGRPPAAAPAVKAATPAGKPSKAVQAAKPGVQKLDAAEKANTVPCRKCGRLNAKNPATRPDCQVATACRRRVAAAKAGAPAPAAAEVRL